MDAVNAFNQEVRGARGRAATGQAGRFSRCPRAFRAPTRGGDASCPGFRDGGPEAEERSRWGADPAPLPRHAPFAPFRPAPAPAPPTWPLCSRSGYRLGGAEVPPGVAAERGREGGLRGGSSCGLGGRGGRRRLRSPVAQAAARRPLDSDPGRLAERERVREGIYYPPPASWPDTLTNKHREVIP